MYKYDKGTDASTKTNTRSWRIIPPRTQASQLRFLRLRFPSLSPIPPASLWAGLTPALPLLLSLLGGVGDDEEALPL